MLTKQDLQDILDKISVPENYNMKLRLKDVKGIWLVQVGSERPCCNTGEMGIGWGGEYRVSPHATEDEIVKKVFSLCLAYVEHEVRENFYWKDCRCFGPHIPLDRMMEAAKVTVGRKEMPTPAGAETIYDYEYK